jgi:hypothetical protein
MSQLASLAGSLSIIGSPATLLRNVGEGVQDFFYEPMEGLVESPKVASLIFSNIAISYVCAIQEFLRGVQRGTRSLVSGVVGSTLNSATGVVNTATAGIALLSGDSEYVQV